MGPVVGNPVTHGLAVLHHLPDPTAGMQALAKNGLRYPIPPYGIQADARAGLGASYPTKAV